MVWNHGVATDDISGLLVGQVAALAGVTTKTVRHYEKLGLIEPSTRASNGYKRFSPDSVVRVVCVASLRRAGVPLSRVGEILDRSPSATGIVQSVVEVLRAERERIDEQLDTLESLGDAMARGEGPLEELGRGVVADIGIALGPERDRVNAHAWRMERRVAGLLASFGLNVDELPDSARAYIRDHAADVAAALDADAALAGLRDATIDDPRVDDVAGQIRRSRATVAALAELVELPGDGVRSALGAVVRPRLSDAQLAALRKAAGIA